MSSSATFEPHVLMRGAIDLEPLIARVPAHFATKGMFFTRLVDLVHDRWHDLEPTLEAPPRFGRYVPFVDYPVRDHIRIIDAAARKGFPAMSQREAHRRMGRLAFDDFRDSRVGKVMLSLIDDPGAALRRFPDAYRLTTRGQRAEATPLEGRFVRVEVDFVVLLEYLVGLFEAVVLAFDTTPRIEAEPRGDAMRFDVRWGDP